LHYEERFYLFHPQRPFYQVAELEIGTRYSAAKLIGDLSESGNTKRLFPARTGRQKEYIGNSETARWLLYLNAFDDTSGKPSKKGGKLAPPGVGWLGNLGLVFAMGENLFDTLLFNSVFLDGNGAPYADERTYWELDRVNTKERVEIVQPRSQLQLLTLQSRRIFLERHPDGKGVTGFILLGGDFFKKENAFVENMTLWREDKNIFTPKTHDPAKLFWRDYQALTVKGEKRKRPGIVDWLALLKSAGMLRNEAIRFHCASVKYGDKNSSIDDIASDSIAVNSGLLADAGEPWNARVCHLIEQTENCVKELGYLSQNVAKAVGNSDARNLAGVGEREREQAYFTLDLPFRRWLAGVDPDRDHDKIDEVSRTWLDQMRELVLKQGKQIVDAAGEKALVGKYETNHKTGKTKPVNSVISFMRFVKQIKRIAGGET
jgi:CRISPR system Cascade subunit CasA